MAPLASLGDPMCRPIHTESLAALRNEWLAIQALHETRGIVLRNELDEGEALDAQSSKFVLPCEAFTNKLWH